MTPSQQLNLARSLFLQHCLDTADAGAAAHTEVRESVVIRDGFYVGRRFQAGEFSAVWFAEENELKIYDSEGCVVESPSSADHQERRAA